MCTNDKSDMELEVISHTPDDQNEEELNNLYSELYKSLGVEPGLLSRSGIGRKIENKFKHDESITTNNTPRCIDENTPPTATHTLIKQSPLSGTKFLLDKSDIIHQLDPEFETLLNEYRIKHELSSTHLQRQIDAYSKKYFNFFI